MIEPLTRSPTRTDVIGAAGVSLLATISTAAGFVFRNLTGIDLGIDGAVEVFKGGRTLGHVLVQCKCTTIARGNRGRRRSVKVANAATVLKYWRSQRLPVILVEAWLPPGRGIATRLTAVNIADKSVAATSSVITWQNGCRGELNLRTIGDVAGIEEFKKYLIEVAEHGTESSLENAVWLSERAINSADFNSARLLLEPFLSKEGVSDPRILIQSHRVSRREGIWSPVETEKKLHELTLRPNLKIKCDALHEIAYSYLVGAMWDYCEAKSRKRMATRALEYCEASLVHLRRWRGAVLKREASSAALNRPPEDTLLYALTVKSVLEGNEALLRAERQSLCHSLNRLRTRTIEQRLTLWLHALVTESVEEACRLMNEIWLSFSKASNDRSWNSLTFGYILLLRAWTLRVSDEHAKEVFQAAATAIGGVLLYPEAEFWKMECLRRFPDLQS